MDIFMDFMDFSEYLHYFCDYLKFDMRFYYFTILNISFNCIEASLKQAISVNS